MIGCILGILLIILILGPLLIIMLDFILFGGMLTEYIQDKSRNWLEKKLYGDKK